MPARAWKCLARATLFTTFCEGRLKRRLMDKADDIIEVNMFEDPTYKVLTDQT